jgi:proteasome activator subunit 4
MSSPVPEFNFPRPNARRPLNVGNSSNLDLNALSKFSDLNQRGNSASPLFSKELDRPQNYGLDISNDDGEAEKELSNPDSPFFATNKSRRLKNKALLPYKTETIRDQYKYLSHIIAHIYIAIKSLDLKGNLTISVEDLEAAKNIIINNKDQDAFINSVITPTIDGQKFETLHSNESEAIEDDENEDDSDYYESSDDEEDEDAANSTPIMKIEPESASIISLKYWTKELKNLLKMGLIIPLDITKKLIKVFYSLCLSRGQTIDITFYTQAITLLIREKKLLIKSGFVLDWEPVYEEFASTLGNPTTFGPSMRDNRYKKLISFALTVKPFFDSNSVQLIMEKIMTRMTNQTVSTSLIHLTIMLPMHFEKPTINPDNIVIYDKNDSRYYLPILFNLWLNNKSDKEINCLLSVIMNISVENLKQGAEDNSILYRGKYGIFTKHQYTFMMNQLFLSSQIRHKDNRMIKYCKIISQIIINSLSSQVAFENEGVIDFLKTYADSIYTLIHPSNSGPWSAILSDVVKKLAVSLHLRVQGEKEDRDLVPLYHPNYSGLPDNFKLNDSVVESVVKILLPLIHLGSQSKSSSHRRRYNEALQVLCFMKPHLVLDKLLLDWYASFESVNSTHRIPIVINQLSQLSRLIVQLPVYRVHIARFLSLLLPAIDSNDPEKTIMTTDFVTSVAAVIPFADLTEGSGDGGLCAIDFTTQHLTYLESKFYESAPASSQFGEQNIPESFEYDPEYELEALKSATSSFKEFLTQFCDNCFKFLEVSPAIDSTNTIESQACALISYCFESLIESMSDELYNVVADKFYEYVTNNVRHEVALVFCNISEAIVRRSPKCQLKRMMEFFMPHIRDEIKHGAGVSRSQEVLSKDQRLIWNMRILSGAISGSTVEILPYLSEIENFIVLNTNKLKGTAGLCAAMIASCALSTLSYLKPLERRLISEKWLEENGGKYTEQCWGAFQFTHLRFDLKYLDFKWYVPTSEEVDAVAESFENMSLPAINFVNNMSKKLEDSTNVSLEEIDQIGFHVELLEGLLKGACCLFDQNYTEPLENKHLDKVKPANRLTPLSSLPSLVNMAKSTSTTSLSTEVLKKNIHPINLKTESSILVKESAKDELMAVDDETSDINPINREIELEIEKTDFSSNESILGADIESELPTRAATPNLPESIEAVDSSLTKRADILYTYGPYYSNKDFSKVLDPSYQRLHSTRAQIGNCLHFLVKTLAKRDGSVDLISKVIQCISTWLNDCGYYSTDNEVYTDNLHFVCLLDFPGVFAPYTRTILASRLAVYHCSRISISCCTRLPTKLDKVLIKDLVSLAASPYSITASHSASILGTTLNRVMNCTSSVFNVFKDWEQAILNKDKEILLNIMIMFDKKKLRGLVEKSASMLPRYEDLLFKSAELNEEEVTVMSMRLFKSIKKYVKIPALVCIFDEKMIEGIRPPDSDVDFKISSLKLAKSKKKVHLGKLLSALVNTSVNRLSKKLNWKFMLLVLELITTIQSHLEIPLEKDVLSTMLKFIDGSHPEVSKKGMFWIASIMDTVESRAFNNYELTNMLALKPEDPTIVSFKEFALTNTAESFFQEIQNIEDPKFFIDNKEWIPTFPWNKELNVVKLFDRTGFNFNEADEIAIRQFAAGINKEWLLKLLNTHIDESESTSAFFPGIVYFFSSITTLVLFGYLELTLKDLFEISDMIFKGDERPTHVAVSEIFCGVLFSCKNSEGAMKIADEEITQRLQKIFDKHLTQSTYKMWSIFSWWLSSHFDIRRAPKILHLLCDFEVDNDPKKSPFALSCRLAFLKSYLGSVTNRFHNFDEITHRMFSILAHPYDVISGEVSAVLFDILFYRSTDEINDFNEYLEKVHEDPLGMGSIEHNKNVIFCEHFKLFLAKTLALAEENEGKTPQEIVNSDFMYHIKGLSLLLFRILKTSMNPQLVEYLCPYILPLVLELDKVKDACTLAEINVDALFLILGSIRFKEEDNDRVIELLETNMGWQTPKITQYKHILAFFGVYGTVRFLERSAEQRKKLMDFTCSMLFNKHLYLREQYGQNIKVFIHLFLDSEREEIIKHYIKKFKNIIKKNKQGKNIKMTTEQSNLVHGATLGLCALVEAYPYTTPPPKWLPEVLTILEVRCTGYSGSIGRAAKDTLSQFKKTRQDTWHIDCKFFTEEQLEDLEGVLYKSYYL